MLQILVTFVTETLLDQRFLVLNLCYLFQHACYSIQYLPPVEYYQLRAGSESLIEDKQHKQRRNLCFNILKYVSFNEINSLMLHLICCKYYYQGIQNHGEFL